MQGYLRRQLRVYLVDDHDIVRQGLRDLLSAHRDIWLVGDTHSARKAIELVPRLDIDVLVLDLHLQDGSGIEVCRATRSADPDVAALLLTSAGDQEALTSAILAGAAGYVIKLARSSDILDAVRRVGAGRSLLDPTLVEEAVRRLHDELSRVEPALTAHEVTLLTHILDGRLTDGEIAEQTGRPLEQVSRDISTLIDRLTSPVHGPSRRPRTE